MYTPKLNLTWAQIMTPIRVQPPDTPGRVKYICLPEETPGRSAQTSRTKRLERIAREKEKPKQSPTPTPGTARARDDIANGVRGYTGIQLVDVPTGSQLRTPGNSKGRHSIRSPTPGKGRQGKGGTREYNW